MESEYAPVNGTFVERAIHGTMSTIAALKSKYGVFSIVATSVSDFIKPIIDTTQPLIFFSGAAALLFFVLQKFAGSFRGTVLAGTKFFSLVFVCSLGWWGLQKAVPGANANGAIATIVPGATAVQNAVLASLGRIEQQAKRVGDILEGSEKRTREQQKETERKQREEFGMMRQRIVDAGYSVNSRGLLGAVRAGYRYVGDFAKLNVKPSEAAVAAELPLVATKEEVARVRDYLNREKDDYTFIRRIVQALEADRAKLKDLFEGPNARAMLCRRDVNTHGFAWARLEQVCKMDGFTFAIRYAEFAEENFGLQLQPVALSSRSIETLPTTKLGASSLIHLPARCGYYEVDASFVVLMPALQPTGNGTSINMFYDRGHAAASGIIEVADPDYEKFKFEQACQIGTNRTCRARFVLASSCEGSNIRLIKVLSPSSAPERSSTPAQPIPATPAPPQTQSAPPANPPATPPVIASAQPPAAAQKQTTTDLARPTAPVTQKSAGGGLTADTVRRMLLGNEVDHAGKLSFIYKPNGTFDAADGRVASSGNYRIESDGRVCWSNSRGISGCFLYYRNGTALHVRRADANNREEIGPVKLTAR